VFGFAGRACRLNTQEAFWYLTRHAYWHQHAPPEPYQPLVQRHFKCHHKIVARSFGQSLVNFQALNLFIYVSIYVWSRVSSGSIVSDYGLDDRAIEVRSPAEAKDFSSILCVQTDSGAHPASSPMGFTFTTFM
jgi:hypothetical protein